MRKVMFRKGLPRPKPRISFKSSLCRFMKTTPAAMKSTSLMREWFIMWRKIPPAARLPCSPRRQSMAVPTRMNPIWDMEEQARVLFKSTEKTARTAPENMVMTPRIKIRVPQFWSPEKR